MNKKGVIRRKKGERKRGNENTEGGKKRCRVHRGEKDGAESRVHRGDKDGAESRVHRGERIVAREGREEKYENAKRR